MEMKHEQVHAVCPSSCPCCMSMSTLHGFLCCTAACPFCMSILHVCVKTAFPCLCSMSMSMVHVQVRAAYLCPCCCLHPCCKSMSMLHVHVPAVCERPCCMSLSIQLVQIYTAEHCFRTYLFRFYSLHIIYHFASNCFYFLPFIFDLHPKFSNSLRSEHKRI
jgi:hypothetical protein